MEVGQGHMELMLQGLMAQGHIELLLQGPLLALPQAPFVEEGEPHDADAAQEDDGFTEVRSRRFGRVRGMHPEGPYIPEEEKVIELEYPWFPKMGPRRKVMKWVQARKGGCIGTLEGPAYFIYGTHGLNNTLEY